MVTHEERGTTLESTDTERTSRVRLQTFRRSFEEICAGEAPWIPLGKFMHQFFGCFSHLRPELVGESIEVPEHCSPEQFQWAVFCAASVEYLCKKYDIPCPEWALNPRYSLEDPWYYALALTSHGCRKNCVRPRQSHLQNATSSVATAFSIINTSMKGVKDAASQHSFLPRSVVFSAKSQPSLFWSHVG